MIIEWNGVVINIFITKWGLWSLLTMTRFCFLVVFFLFTSLSRWNRTDYVSTKDVWVKWKVLLLFSGLLQVQLQVCVDNEWKSMQRPRKGSRAELRASESAVVKVTDHLLQRQQRSPRTPLLPCSLLRYHLLFSFCILLTHLLLHLAVFLLCRQRQSLVVGRWP